MIPADALNDHRQREGEDLNERKELLVSPRR
jgi:hypothetical protein